MRKNFLNYLEGAWEIVSFRDLDDHVIDGMLISKSNDRRVPVVGGIPRFVPLDFLEQDSDYGEFAQKYHSEQLPHFRNESVIRHSLSKHTSRNFGFEWEYFGDWGWIEDESVSSEEREYKYRGGLKSHTEKAFEIKCLLSKNDLAEGKVILDAGCGNGRYTNQAAKYGATVIGVDLGHGIKRAFRHLKHHKNIHLAQADLFNLPFKKDLFDVIFSNGVLMHTGNAMKAFQSIARHNQTQGVFVAHLYHKRNPVFEVVDGTLRFFTSRMSIEHNLKFARWMAALGQKLKKKGTWQKWFKYIEILPTEHHMFDWYSAPIATHHTYPEVKQWFLNEHYEVIQTNEDRSPSVTFWNKPEALTVKGQKIHL